MSKLLPCPFCGGEASKRLFYGGKYGIYCDECSARVGGLYDTEAEAVAAWNARAERIYATGGIIARVECRNVCNSLSEFTCDRCGFNCDLTSWISLFDGDEGRHRHHHHGTPNYCPNCGAKVVCE